MLSSYLRVVLFFLSLGTLYTYVHVHVVMLDCGVLVALLGRIWAVLG